VEATLRESSVPFMIAHDDQRPHEEAPMLALAWRVAKTLVKIWHALLG